MILYCYAVHSQITMSCQAPPVLSSQPTGDKVYLLDIPPCVQYSRCSNDLAAEVPINAINCSIPESTSETIPGNCHLWGSDGPHQQMLLNFAYLLIITSNTMTLHYFNDSSSSQQHPSITRQQLCTANNNLDIGKAISGSCSMGHESPLSVVLPIEDSVCCSNVNISVNFSEKTMEIYFLQGFIGIPVDYLNCTGKS